MSCLSSHVWANREAAPELQHRKAAAGEALMKVASSSAALVQREVKIKEKSK